MKRIMSLAVAFAGCSATAFPADRHVAFERKNAVYVANLDGTNEKRTADGISRLTRVTPLTKKI